MNRDEISHMQAGEDMNIQIMQSVFGMRREKNHGWGGGFYWVGNGVSFGEQPENDITDYSGDISAAWEVVEKINRMWRIVRLPEANMWQVGFIDCIPESEIEANNLPLAICRAALLVTATI